MSVILLPDRHKRKPAGPVELDWSNPLARGLIRAWVPQGGAGPVVDLVTQGNELRPINGARFATDGGECVTDNDAFSTSAAVGNAWLPDIGTMFMVWRRTAALASFRYFIYSNSFSSWSAYVNSSEFYFRHWGSVTTVGSQTARVNILTDGQPRTLAYSYQKNSSVSDIYSEGESIANGSPGSGSLTSDIYSICGRDDSTGRYSGGVTLGYYHWNRILSADEVKDLHNNPWQFTRPATRRRVWVPQVVAAGDPVPIPVAMANYRRQHQGMMH